ncbi:MAG: chemotaxis protein CheC [Candidatus Omnitrophica bacterium]|jgi:chemotaxis protein CheC|nr:chemotaxis protein CheC [Candidatus Omnitrophota bacterium]MDD5079278.1 chemotaxis protein CheC [Candidatus Omnitrophota bacterium]
MEKLNLGNEQLDLFKEIGSIGGGNAATALSQILASKVTISVPQVKLVSSEAVTNSEFQIEPEEVGLAIDFKILGALQGGMVILFSQKSALLMIDILLKKKIGSTQLINLMEASALSEVSHIISGSYINAVGELLELHQLIPSIPRTIVDRMDRLNKLLIRRLSDDSSGYLLPIENNLVIEDIKVDLFVIFLLEQESIRKVLKLSGL